MKKIIAISTVLLLIAGASYGQDKTPRPYKFKSGIIEYKYSGDKTGTATLYFDDYGMKSAMYSEIATKGTVSQIWMVAIGGKMHGWDLKPNRKGTVSENPFMLWLEDNPNGDMESYLEETYGKMGMVKSGTEMFLRKECNVFKGNMGKVLIWYGILMLEDLRMGDSVSHREATSVKTDISVDPKYFNIPENITFSEIPGF